MADWEPEEELSPLDKMKDKVAQYLFDMANKQFDKAVAAIKDHRVADAREATGLAVNAAAGLMNYPRRRDEVGELSARVLRLSMARILKMNN